MIVGDGDGVALSGTVGNGGGVGAPGTGVGLGNHTLEKWLPL